MPTATRFINCITEMDDYADDLVWGGRHTFNDRVYLNSYYNYAKNLTLKDGDNQLWFYFHNNDRATLEAVEDTGETEPLLLELMGASVSICGTGGSETACFSGTGLDLVDGDYLSTDQVRARDGDGLKLYDDGGNGIFIKDGGNAGILTEIPDGTLHVHTATAGAVTAHANANDLVVENSAEAGISILCPATNIGYLMFGDPNDNYAGGIFYTHAAADEDTLTLQVNNSPRITILSDGKTGVGIAVPAAKFHVDQVSTTAAIPVLCLDQADIDQPVVKIVGTAEVGSADRTLVAASDFTTPGAIVAWEMVYVEDIGNRFTDAKYYRPLYAIPTA